MSGVETDPEQLPWTKFPALAERLGVRPMTPEQHSELTLSLPDGRRYDIIAVVDALLDRLDSMSQTLMLRS